MLFVNLIQMLFTFKHYVSDLGMDAFLLFVVLKISVAHFAEMKSYRFQTKGTSLVVRIREMGKSQC